MKAIKRLLFGNWVSSTAGCVFLVFGTGLWYFNLISMDTLVSFSVFPLGLLFSKDNWFKIKNKKNGTSK